MIEVVITLKKCINQSVLRFWNMKSRNRVIHFVAVITYVIPSGLLQLYTLVKIELGKIIDLKLFRLKSIISIMIMLIHVWH